MLSINWSWIPIAKTTVTAAEIWRRECFQKNRSKRLSAGISISWSKILAFLFIITIVWNEISTKIKLWLIARCFRSMPSYQKRCDDDEPQNAIIRPSRWTHTNRQDHCVQLEYCFLKKRRKLFQNVRTHYWDRSHLYILASQIDETFAHTLRVTWVLSSLASGCVAFLLALSWRCTFAALSRQRFS